MTDEEAAKWCDPMSFVWSAWAETLGIMVAQDKDRDAENTAEATVTSINRKPPFSYGLTGS